jgi:hypothetical protein|tara:strand:+ start:1459 stop:2247 length:789 start_codon:yes stop_codon:yes gene_type:complete
MEAPPFFIMAHFYNCEVISDPTFNPDVETPAQARKHRKVYPSVTTVLGIVKDAFLDSIYKPRMMAQLAREKPNLHWKDLERLTYGTREHPMTGEVIESSEFGTTVHKVIEDHINHFWLQQGAHPEDTVWNDWAEPFVQWVESNGVKPIACEKVVANNRIKIAGSVDFIGHDTEGKLFLGDYKCRTNTKGKAKVYDKDCQQLAIESWMLMKEYSLDYLPECRSVIIDCDTTAHMHHVWSSKDMEKGIKVAKKCAELYWMLRMS